ncbi:hypothetical protein F4776DRAFT_622730 [Hypoxylon sp. NC0597]|nr:hypothetical protein F4776DRAFT_622730 [Hypoxylon sp. NC0597]
MPPKADAAPAAPAAPIPAAPAAPAAPAKTPKQAIKKVVKKVVKTAAVPPDGPLTVMDLVRTNVLDVADMGVRGGRTSYPKRWPAKNRDKVGPITLPVGWRQNKRILNAWDALQILQTSRDMYLIGHCLTESFDHYARTLPDPVRDDVRIMDLGPGHVFGATDEAFAAYLTRQFNPSLPIGYERTPARYRPLYEKPYVFWTIDAEPTGVHHWVTVIIHLEQPPIPNPDWVEGDPEEDRFVKDQLFRRVESIAVVDPDATDDGSRTTRIYNRVIALLHQCAIYVNASFQGPTTLWVPPASPVQYQGENGEYEEGARDIWSSGLRSFDLVRQMLIRLTESYSVAPGVHNGDDFWRPTCGWFNPDAVRTEMIGYVAMQLNFYMGYNTRVAIETVASMQFDDRLVITNKLEPDRNFTDLFIPGSRDVNGQPIMWAEPLEEGENSDDDPEVDGEEVFGPGDDDDDDDDGGAGGGAVGNVGGDRGDADGDHADGDHADDGDNDDNDDNDDGDDGNKSKSNVPDPKGKSTASSSRIETSKEVAPRDPKTIAPPKKTSPETDSDSSDDGTTKKKPAAEKTPPPKGPKPGKGKNNGGEEGEEEDLERLYKELFSKKKGTKRKSPSDATEPGSKKPRN